MGGPCLQKQAQVSAWFSRFSLVILCFCFVLAPWTHWTISPSPSLHAHSCLDCLFCLMSPAFLVVSAGCISLPSGLGTSRRHLSQTCITGRGFFPLCISIVSGSFSAPSGRQMCFTREAVGPGKPGEAISYLLFCYCLAWPFVDVVELNWVTQFKPLMF